MKHDRNKQKPWQTIADTVKRITDALGKRVDTGIKDVVICLLANGFTTEGSCEGHMDQGLKAPWVDVGKNLPQKYFVLFDTYGLPHQSGKPPHVDDVFAAYPELVRLRDANLRDQKRLLTLLRDFYRLHHSPSETHLVLEEKGCYGAARLVPQGYSRQELRSPKRQAEHLSFYQQEMQAFATFLRERYVQHQQKKQSQGESLQEKTLPGSFTAHAT